MADRDIAVGVIWFGPLPSWIDRFVERALASQRIQLVCIGDVADVPGGAAVWRRLYDQAELEKLMQRRLGYRCHKLDVRHTGDYRIALPAIFPDVFEPFPWWGWAEFDGVWGDWDSYLTDDHLAQWDVISATGIPDSLQGPFTLLRNIPAITEKWRDLKAEFESPYYISLDETRIDAEFKRMDLRVLHADIEANDGRGCRATCIIEGGKLFATVGTLTREVLLYHFPGTKNRTGWPVGVDHVW